MSDGGCDAGFWRGDTGGMSDGGGTWLNEAAGKPGDSLLTAQEADGVDGNGGKAKPCGSWLPACLPEADAPEAWLADGSGNVPMAATMPDRLAADFSVLASGLFVLSPALGV
jgi:hypothetical protein